MSVVPMWFDNAEVSMVYTSATGFKYCWVEYLGIRFRVSSDKMKFSYEDLVKAFNGTSGWSSFSSGKNGSEILKAFGDDIVTVKNSKTANGHYLPWVMFDGVLYRAAGMMNAIRFLKGDELDLSAPGYLYLIQPAASPKGCAMETCVGSSVYKFGRTWSMNQRMNMYGNGTEVYCSVHVSDMVVGEAILKEVAKERSDDQEAIYGGEYFEYEDGLDALDAFFEAIERMKLKGIIVSE